MLLCMSTASLFAQTPSLSASSAYYLKSLPAHTNKTFHILVQVDPAVITAQTFEGCDINSKAGDVWSVSVPASRLEKLMQTKGIRNMEISAPSKPMMDDSSRVLVNANNVYEGVNLPKAFKGKDVVIGVIDVGFDYTHTAFRDASGTSRIKRVWEQIYAGSPPTGFTYGRELTTPAEIVQAGQDRLNETHGTGVVSIASGKPEGKSNRGMAPEADIVLVALDYGPEDSYIGDATVAPAHILDGINYIFKYAESVGKPAVVNLSWGHHQGPHDGTTILDKGIENLVGSGKIFVVAAGNEGQNMLHLNATLINDTVFTCSRFNDYVYQFMRDAGEPERNMTDFWGSPGTNFAVSLQLRSATETVVAQTPFFTSGSNSVNSSFIVYNSDTLFFTISTKATDPLNNKPEILVKFTNQCSTARVVYAITSPNTNLHAWNCGYSWDYYYPDFAPFVTTPNSMMRKGLSGNTSYCIGESGGNCKDAITVGAYTSNVDWFTNAGQLFQLGMPEGGIAAFSSTGPSADGSIKPDITAPGFYIAAALPRYYTGEVYSFFLTDSFFADGRSNRYAMGFGTSFAAPVVTGAIALMLEATPTLTPAEVKNILKQTAINDINTGNAKQNPSPVWGYGKLDAYEAVKYTLNTTGIKDQNMMLFDIYPNPFSGELSLSLSEQGAGMVMINLYDLQGRAIRSFEKQNEQVIRIETQDLVAGVYFMQVTYNGKSSMQKVICTK